MSALVTRTPLAVDGSLPGLREAHSWFDEVVARQRALGFDAHDYLYQSWAYEAHDVGGTRGFDGDTQRALASIKTKALVLSPPLDLFNPSESARAAAEAIPGARFVEIPSEQGHQAATSLRSEDAAFLNRTLGAFLHAE
jgi:homoserine O-acetyltransferase